MSGLYPDKLPATSKNFNPKYVEYNPGLYAAINAGQPSPDDAFQMAEIQYLQAKHAELNNMKDINAARKQFATDQIEEFMKSTAVDCTLNLVENNLSYKEIIMEINDLTQIILDCSYRVHSTLGPGLLESAYKECLFYELNLNGLKVEKQKSLPLVYKDIKFLVYIF